ncbi:MAG: hypothetical protein BGO76_00675 [Caedibacter sp. 38-128]|nr:hypothetical protein [Holosporales bacterium]OJX05166.1 MAG: hypothetical protein BGO76_00675 [Caedibacter sp. 38-128]
MMNIDEQKTNFTKNHGSQTGLGKSTIMKRLLKEDLKREACCFKASQGDKRRREWHQIFNRWWDLIFDEGGRILFLVISEDQATPKTLPRRKVGIQGRQTGNEWRQEAAKRCEKKNKKR